ncbi:MAG: 1-(5-phosphoribosyl)-5-[(5-phosphoribosylamino)methylideneamino]imidazole-4-carboxamide isomerase [Candidatus Margulisiibacteriota bacterium]
MSFEIIPAVDILGGKCVRLKQGRFEQKTVYFEDPLEAAKLWESKGAKRLHVVDLDGARTGTPENLSIVKKIAKELNIPIEVGGGVRRMDQIEELIKMGVDRIVLGTSAIFNHNLLSNVCEKFGEQIIVSVDAKGEDVVANGWTRVSSKNVTTLASEAISLGVKRFIYTDISKDGMLKGPNFTAIEKFAASVTVPVIASGGVSAKQDVERLKELPIEGCIIGQALYSGAVKLEEVL